MELKLLPVSHPSYWGTHPHSCTTYPLLIIHLQALKISKIGKSLFLQKKKITEKEFTNSLLATLSWSYSKFDDFASPFYSVSLKIISIFKLLNLKNITFSQFMAAKFLWMLF
jgi:hypothetical protein